MPLTRDSSRERDSGDGREGGGEKGMKVGMEVMVVWLVIEGRGGIQGRGVWG